MREPYFLERFSKISSTEYFEKKYEWNTQKTCKFCSRSSNETTFENVPHVLPELFGKNNFTSNDECDECNQLFGRFENDLANYISPYQTLIGLKTKSKIPIFQSRKTKDERSTMIKNVDGIPNFSFGKNLSDFKYDYDNKLINLNIRKKKFIPINVYKGLVKIGLSLCPNEELTKYRKTIDWLSNLDNDIENLVFDIPLILMRTRFKNKYHLKPSATLYKRNEGISGNIFRPNLCLVVYSGILVFQIFIPFNKETENINPSKYSFKYDLFPAFITDLDFPKDAEKITINLSNLPVVKYNMNWYQQVEEDELIQLSFENIISG